MSKLTKGSKIRILENFYALDEVFFGTSLKKYAKKTCCPLLVEDYLSIKGALMSVMIEMYKLMKHSPKVKKIKMNSKMIMNEAIKNAGISRSVALKIVSSKKGKKTIARIVKENFQLKKKKRNVKLDSIIRRSIVERTHSIAVDNLLVGRALMESKNVKKMNVWEGLILEDAYKILRDSLIESAFNIIRNV